MTDAQSKVAPKVQREQQAHKEDEKEMARHQSKREVPAAAAAVTLAPQALHSQRAQLEAAAADARIEEMISNKSSWTPPSTEAITITAKVIASTIRIVLLSKTPLKLQTTAKLLTYAIS